MTVLEHLCQDAKVAELREVLSKATTERERYRELYMMLLERCRMLDRGIVAGQKAERFNSEEDGQLLGMLLSGEEPAALEGDLDELLGELEDEDGRRCFSRRRLSSGSLPTSSALSPSVNTPRRGNAEIQVATRRSPSDSYSDVVEDDELSRKSRVVD